MNKRPGFFDFDTPFFYPVWRRYTVLAVLFAWGMFELYAGAIIWAIIFLGLAVVAALKMYQTDWSEVKTDDRNDPDE